MALAETQSLEAEPDSIRLELRPALTQATRNANWRAMELLLWLMPLALVLRKTLLLRRRSLDDFLVVDSAAISQVLTVLGCAVFVLLSGRLGLARRRLRHTAAGALLAYYLLGAGSAIWSVIPKFTIYRAFEVIVQYLAIFIALTYCRNFIAAEKRFLVITGLVIALSMGGVIKNSGLTMNFKFWHTNGYTVCGMMLAVYATGELMSGRRGNRKNLWRAGGVGLIATAIGTSSASSISLLFGLALCCLLTRYRARAVVLLTLSLLLLVAAGGPAHLKHLVFYGKKEDSINRLTGRRALWEHYWQEYQKKPVQGFGFAVAARIATFHKTTNTHSSFFAVIMGTGLLGLGVVTWALRRLLNEVRRAVREQRPGAIGATAALLAGLLNSLSTAFLGEGWAYSTLPYVCLLGVFTLHILQGQVGQGVARLTPRGSSLPGSVQHVPCPYVMMKKKQLNAPGASADFHPLGPEPPCGS